MFKGLKESCILKRFQDHMRRGFKNCIEQIPTKSHQRRDKIIHFHDSPEIDDICFHLQHETLRFDES